MNLGCVYHRSQDNLCYAKNEKELVIQIQTGLDVERVLLNYEDPMISDTFGGSWDWKGEAVPMTDCRRLKYHKLWSVTVVPPYKRCGYFFELYGQGEVWYFLEDGFYRPEELVLKNNKIAYFTFPWMNPSDINVTPGWVRDTVWYQIFPERFCMGDPSLPRPGLLPWTSGPVDNTQFYGGDLPGITSRLPYLAGLGINGLYLTPIFESPSTHKYDTTDYRRIDPAFGTEEDFQTLVASAHSLGIRVMLDGVFNHCGYRFAPWQDVLQNGPQSRYWDWFMVNQWPFDQSDPWTYDKKYYTFHFTAHMPKLNTNNPEVADYLAGICEYWVREFDIDGFRLDVAHEVSHSFCRLLRSRLKSLKPDLYILGEIWHDSMRWLRGEEFDSVMNYPFKNAVLGFWTKKGANRNEFMYSINACYSLYMEQTNAVLFNLLDSHDTKRLRSALPDEDAFWQALAVLYTMPGSPCIFYGTEIAMPGGPDPDCRRCMPWDEIENGLHDEQIETLKSLIALRRSEPLLRSPQLLFPECALPDRVLLYQRPGAGSSLTVCVNGDCQPVPLPEGELLCARRAKDGLLLPGGYSVTRTKNGERR